MENNSSEPTVYQTPLPPPTAFARLAKKLRFPKTPRPDRSILAVVMMFSLTGGVAVGVYLNQKPTQIAPRAVEVSPTATPTPFPDQSISLHLASPSAQINIGDPVNVDIKVRTDREYGNVFVAKVNFPSQLLEVRRLDKKDSFIPQNWTEEFFDNKTGQISVAGAVPNPGLKTASESAQFIQVQFRAKAAGEAKLEISPESQLYSNTTNTNILQSFESLSITIQPNASASVLLSPSPAIATPSPSPSPSPVASATNPCGQKGDGNGDCQVNFQDLSTLMTQFNASTNNANATSLDFNSDNRINTFDFSALGDKLYQLGVIRRR